MKLCAREIKPETHLIDLSKRALIRYTQNVNHKIIYFSEWGNMTRNTGNRHLHML